MTQNVAGSGAGGIQLVSIRPEDIAALAAQVVKGLHGELFPGLEQLFKTHEQQLLQELKREHNPPSSSTSLLTSVRRLSRKSQVSTSSTVQKSPSTPSRRPSTGNNISVLARRLDPRAYFSTPAERTNRTLDHKGLGWGNTISERHWLAWWHQPSDMKRLEDARDSELLGEVPDRSAAHLEDTVNRNVHTCPDLGGSRDDDTLSRPQRDFRGTAKSHKDGQVWAKSSKACQRQARDTYDDVMHTLKCTGNINNRPTNTQKLGGLGKSAKEVAALPVQPHLAGSVTVGQSVASVQHPPSRHTAPSKITTNDVDKTIDELGIVPTVVQTPNFSTNNSSLEEDLLSTVWPDDVTAAAVTAESHPRRCFLPSRCQKQAEASYQEFMDLLHQNANVADDWPASSQQLGELDRAAKEVAVAAEPAQVHPPMPLPEQLPVPDSGPTELTNTVAQGQHLTEQFQKDRSSDMGSLPGVPQGLGQSCSVEDDLVHKAHVPVDPATTDPPANLCTSLLLAQHPPRAERPGAAASAAVTGAAAVKDHSQGHLFSAPRTWSMSSIRTSSESCGSSRCVESPAHLPRLSERSWAISVAAAALSRSARRSVSSDSDSFAVRLKREEELLDEGTSPIPASAAGLSASPNRGEECRPSMPIGYNVQGMGSPLFLRLCGILPWTKNRLGMAYRCGTLMLAVCPVFVFGANFYEAQSHMARPADCPAGVCVHFRNLSHLVLAVGSFLGLLAARKLDSPKLLGGPAALLVRYAVEHGVLYRWYSITSWHSLYLAVAWVVSLVLRAVAMAPNSSWQDLAWAASIVLSSLFFTGLIFGILYVSSLVCILVDSYVRSVRETMDPARCIHEWDRLVALLRRVSRAVDTSFLIVQFTAAGVVLCTFSSVMLHGGQQVWWFVSDVLLAQSLILIFFKTAEVTEMCKRMPSLINSLDFDGDNFSSERHYLVEHVSYSAAGFYVGEVRLTAWMALKLLYLSILAALSILTKLSTA